MKVPLVISFFATTTVLLLGLFLWQVSFNTSQTNYYEALIDKYNNAQHKNQEQWVKICEKYGEYICTGEEIGGNG